LVDEDGTSEPRPVWVDESEPRQDCAVAWLDSDRLAWLRAVPGQDGHAQIVVHDLVTGDQETVVGDMIVHPSSALAVAGPDRVVLGSVVEGNAELFEVAMGTGAVTGITSTPEVQEKYPAAVPSACGNGVLEGWLGEDCDDGADNGSVPEGCSVHCTVPASGNGAVEGGELFEAWAVHEVERRCTSESLGVGDYDGDGYGDVAVSGFDETWVLSGEPMPDDAGGGVAPSRFSPLVSIDGVSSANPVLVDVNRDSRGDLVLPGTGERRVHVYLSQPAGPIPMPVLDHSVAVGRTLAGRADGDLNPDLYVLSRQIEHGALCVWRGLGDGRFERISETPLERGASCMTVADFDQDGLDDAAVTHLKGVAETWILLNRAGTLEPASVIGVGVVVGGLSAGDVTGDGLVDIVVVKQEWPAEIAVWKGNGKGGFVELPSTIPVSNQSAGVGGDLDDDGRLDVVVRASGKDELSVYRGDGVGGFVPAAGSSRDLGNQPGIPSLGFINRDAYPDVVIPHALGLQVFLSRP